MAGFVAGYLVNGLNALLGRFFVKSGTPDYLSFSFSTQSELTFAEKKIWCGDYSFHSTLKMRRINVALENADRIFGLRMNFAIIHDFACRCVVYETVSKVVCSHAHPGKWLQSYRGGWFSGYSSLSAPVPDRNTCV